MPAKAKSGRYKFLLIAALALVLAIAAVIFISFQYRQPSAEQLTPTKINKWPPPTPAGPDSYSECVAKGYPVQQFYPEVCSVPGGPSFTNPDQKLR